MDVKRREFLKLSGTAALGSMAFSALGGCRRGAEQAASPQLVASQVGYFRGTAKAATLQLAQHAAEAKSFRVRRKADGGQVYASAPSAAAMDALSGDRVQRLDFSSVKEPGAYVLETDDGRRAEVQVGDDVYRHGLWLATRGYYGQRCGCSVNLGGGYQHPPCHLDDAFHESSGKTGSFKNYGGWHDAGDYGRYIVNSGISTGTLLWTWELYRDALQSMKLQIPESGGKVPDFLAEVQWNLNWMLALQDEDGGVWDKQTSLHFCAFIMPQDDKLTSYVIGSGTPPYKVTTATGDFAAVMAIAARLYKEFDAGFATRCQQAAERAWTWTMAHPDALYTKNPAGVSTGGYTDPQGSDELMWASAELWRTTGDAKYEAALLRNAGEGNSKIAIDVPSWSNVGSMAWWTYALSGKGQQAVVDKVQAATLALADQFAKQSKANGYGQTLVETDYIWGSNGVAGNHALLLLLAQRFHPAGDYRAAALGNLEYLLGRNCFGVSWVTQLGTNPFQQPHHRPSVADGIAAPWPGLLSGGPNRNPGDPVMRKLPHRPPMRMWVDNWQAFSANEIAINWNAPLVFALAGVQS